MAEKFVIERGNDHDVRQRITRFLDDLDGRVTIIEDYVGNAPQGGIVVRLKFNASVLGGDPGAGYVAVDNADPALVTKLYISKTSEPGNDIGPILTGVQPETVIGIFEGLAPNATAYFEVDNTTDQGTYVEYNIVDYSTGAALPTDQALCDVYIIRSSNQLLPPGGDTDWILKKTSSNDYEVIWVDGTTLFTPISHLSDLDNPHEVQHAQLLGKTPDDHHNQVHLLYGPDHSDVDTGTTLQTRHVLAWNAGNFVAEYRMNWRGSWGPQQYETGDVVFDEGYTMIANKPTLDRAAPTPLGGPEYALPDVPLWTQYSNKSIVYSGHLYTFTETGYFRSLRVWVPELTANTNYNIVLVRNPNSANPAYTTINDPILNVNDWTVLSVDTVLVGAGEELLVYIDALNSGSEQTWAYNWLYGGQVQNVLPVAGDWQINQQESVLGINWLDAEAVPVDHQLELQVVPNTVFEISELGNPQNYRHYQVQGAYVEAAGFTQYSVVVVDTGGVWPPPLTTGTQIRAVQPIADPTKFVGIPGHWLGNQPVWGTIESFLSFDGVNSGADPNNAYGVDVSFQRLDISDDWDLVALSGGGGGGGGEGGEPFPEVPDDGITYGRIFGTWEPVYSRTEIDTAGYLTDAPSDGTAYGRLDGAWEAIYTQTEVDTSQGIQDGRLDTLELHPPLTNNPHAVTFAQTGAAPEVHDHVDFTGIGTRGFVPDPVAGGNKFLRDDGSWQEVNSIPAGGVSTKYDFSDSLAGTPGTGFLSVNNADQTLATSVAVNKVNKEANDISPWLLNMKLTDIIGLNVVGGGGETAYYRLEADSVDQGGHVTMEVSHYSGPGGILDGQELDLILINNPASKVPAGGLEGQHLAKLTDTNYDTYWVDALDIAFKIITTTTAAEGGNSLAADSELGGFIIQLPTLPDDEDVINIIDPTGYWDINNVTVDRNGNLIDGQAENMELDIKWGQLALIFRAGDWLINPDGIGTKGDVGDQGATGPQGPQGQDGSDGIDGADGSPGVGTYADNIYDSFTGPNGTSLDAHAPDLDTPGFGWSQAGHEIQGNKASPKTDGGNLSHIDSGSAAHYVSGYLTFDQLADVNDNSIGVGLVCRSNGLEALDGFVCSVWNTGGADPVIGIQKATGGALTVSASKALTGIGPINGQTGYMTVEAREDIINVRLTLGGSSYGISFASTDFNTQTFTGLYSKAASVTAVSGICHCDNEVEIFLSTDDSVEGVLQASGTNWSTPTNLNAVELTPGVTNYLHFRCVNSATGPAMLIGEFDLDSTDFEFPNSSQNLLTDATWRTSETAYQGPDVTTVDLGPNGTSPWGTVANISGSARYIRATAETVLLWYHSVAITPVVAVASTTQIAIDDFRVGLPLAGGLWQENGSEIYYDAGNVGIGNSNPSRQLHVTGETLMGTAGLIYSTAHDQHAFTSTGAIGVIIQSAAGQDSRLLMAQGATKQMHIRCQGSDVSLGSQDKATVINWNAAGNVGILTTTLTHELNVKGSVDITGDYLVNGVPIGGPIWELLGSANVDEWDGLTVKITAGTTLTTVGGIVAVQNNSSGGLRAYWANSASRYPVLGVLVVGGSAGQEIEVLVDGWYKSGYTLTDGEYVYASASNGIPTTTVPTTSGHFAKVIGFNGFDGKMLVKPQMNTVEIS